MGRPNVILITIDSLRADRLGFMGYEKEISPNIDALSKESAVFKRAYSTGPLTPYSFPAILTSTYPLDYHGPGKIERPRKLISEVLKEQGFITAAFHSNPFLSDFFGYNRGWDFFEDLGETHSGPFLEGGRLKVLAKKIFKNVSINFFPRFFFFLPYLKYRRGGAKSSKADGSFLNGVAKDFISSRQNGAPFFLWLHYMDVHSPYFGRENLLKRPLSFTEYMAGCATPIFKRYLGLAEALYSDSIKYLDLQIGDLMKFLKARGIYNNCIILLTSDHGEEFLEHGGSSHGPKLYNELLQVPLLIKIPKEPPKTIEHPVSLLDLAPTLCDILEIKRDLSFKGENLFEREGKPIFYQTGSSKKKGLFSPKIDFVIRHTEIENIGQCKAGCRFRNFKYIFDYKNGQEQLYNLSEDPKEKKNIANLNPQIIFEGRKLIQEFQKKNPPFSLIASAKAEREGRKYGKINF